MGSLHTLFCCFVVNSPSNTDDILVCRVVCMVYRSFLLSDFEEAFVKEYRHSIMKYYDYLMLLILG